MPATSWEERCQAAIDQIRSGTKLVYLYWSDIDAAGHAHGVGSSQWSDALEDFDAGLGRFLSALPDLSLIHIWYRKLRQLGSNQSDVPTGA